MSSSNIDFDATLVDWLYGELDSTEVSRFEAYLESHPEHKAEAVALREMRASFEGFPEAEPSQAVSASLMHKAASAAQPKGGLWAAITGFFQPIAMHPAAAAMATVVLIAGVAGALHVRNGDMKAEQTVASGANSPLEGGDYESVTASRASDKEEAAPEDPAAMAQPSPKLENEVAASAPEGDLLEEPRAGLDDGRVASLATPEQEKLLERVQRKVPTRGKKRKAKNDELSAKQVAIGDGTAMNAISGGALGELRGIADTGGKSAINQPVASAPAPERTVAAEEKNAQSWEDRQVEQFQFAARGKRCKQAGRIANDIKERSPKTYERDVKGSREESDCSYYIASETKRRSRAKTTAKKRAARKGQGKSVPKRATAAPAEDAFETAEGL